MIFEVITLSRISKFWFCTTTACDIYEHYALYEMPRTFYGSCQIIPGITGPDKAELIEDCRDITAMFFDYGIIRSYEWTLLLP